MPLPFRRNTVPVWVPSGMEYFTLPSMVGISSSPPSTAWVKVMGASQNTAVPSRRKMSWGRTMMVISRSPLGPPFRPAWPWPRREMVWPSSMPAGMDTLMVRRCRTLPLPWHSWQGWWMILPVPPHFWQGIWDCMTPKGVRWARMTVPVPRQSGQISGVVPGAQPLPLQAEHCSLRSRVTSFSQPKAASVKLMATLARMLAPRWGPLCRAAPPPKPPPKKLPKISPRSPKSKPPAPP